MDPERRLGVSHQTAAQGRASPACSAVKVRVKAEAAYWGTFVPAKMQELRVDAPYDSFARR